jgi:hypothetical protein
MPPIVVFSAAMKRRSLPEVFIKIKDKIISGASFCHVDRTMADIQEIDIITEGYHKWHGAIPILISNEAIKI